MTPAVSAPLPASLHALREAARVRLGREREEKEAVAARLASVAREALKRQSRLDHPPELFEIGGGEICSPLTHADKTAELLFQLPDSSPIYAVYERSGSEWDREPTWRFVAYEIDDWHERDGKVRSSTKDLGEAMVWAERDGADGAAPFPGEIT